MTCSPVLGQHAIRNSIFVSAPPHSAYPIASSLPECHLRLRVSESLQYFHRPFLLVKHSGGRTLADAVNGVLQLPIGVDHLETGCSVSPCHLR